jgi:prepilin-type processing-associated H-X9-DG protein
MKNRAAFTLTEMLVLTSVGFLLVGAALPSLDDAKQKLQASQCLSNMRQWGLAFALYANDYHDYVPYMGDGRSVDNSFDQSAWFNVLPHYMNQTPLIDLYTATPPRIPVPGGRSVFVCPSAPAVSYTPTNSQPYFSYAMNRVMQGVFPSPPGSGQYKRSIAALPGQVILFSESEDSNPTFSYIDGYFLGLNTPRHYGGDNFVFVDGHAEWVPLAVYRWPQNYGNNAASEWQTSRQVYWFPCPTCSKI